MSGHEVLERVFWWDRWVLINGCGQVDELMVGCFKVVNLKESRGMER